MARLDGMTPWMRGSATAVSSVSRASAPAVTLLFRGRRRHTALNPSSTPPADRPESGARHAESAISNPLFRGRNGVAWCQPAVRRILHDQSQARAGQPQTRLGVTHESQSAGTTPWPEDFWQQYTYIYIYIYLSIYLCKNRRWREGEHLI